jgi:hypothetical protein
MNSAGKEKKKERRQVYLSSDIVVQIDKDIELIKDKTELDLSYSSYVRMCYKDGRVNTLKKFQIEVK